MLYDAGFFGTLHEGKKFRIFDFGFYGFLPSLPLAVERVVGEATTG
jgi:hypothetical protein